MMVTIINHKPVLSVVEGSQIENRIEFPPWYGELGWEIMSWAPYCRMQAKGRDSVIVTSFEGMAPLYADFATGFKSHGQAGRGLDYPKMYRPNGIYHKYGRPEQCAYSFDCLIHARGISRKSTINYRGWGDLLALIKKMPMTCAVIGSAKDHNPYDLWDVQGFRNVDLRGLELQKLMNQISHARLVVGVSSGLMHLAAACGTNIVTWGDRRTYFGETLEQRYKVTWNPFDVKVGWLDGWQPGPERIAEKVKEIYEGTIAKYTATAGRSDDVHAGSERL